MLTVKRALALMPLSALSLVACPSRESHAPPPAPTVSVPVTNVVVSDAGASLVPSAQTDAAAPAASDFASLGSACGDGADDELFCASGKVVGVWRPVDTVKGPVPPAGVELIAQLEAKEFAPGRSLALGIDGDRLYFRLVTCGACRRVLGWAFAGSLSGMSDDQLRMTQARLGLGPSPLLRTRAQWQAAYAHGAGLPGGDGGLRAPSGDGGLPNQ